MAPVPPVGDRKSGASAPLFHWVGRRLRKRIDAFPTQLILTILWGTIGTGVSLHYSNSILWVSLISIYAIVISHWTAHLAWRAKRVAQGDDS